MSTTTNPSSIAFPENAERRAAITRNFQAATGLDEAALQWLDRAFHAAERQDKVLDPLFDGVRIGNSMSGRSRRSGRRSCC